MNNRSPEQEEQFPVGRKKGLAYEWSTMPKWVRTALLILCVAAVAVAVIRKFIP